MATQEYLAGFSHGYKDATEGWEFDTDIEAIDYTEDYVNGYEDGFNEALYN